MATTFKQADDIHNRANGAFNATLSAGDVVDYYEKWARNYDKDINNQDVYKAPPIVAETIGQLYPNDRENVRILDVAAGTGIVGEKLYKYGFCNIDGLDPSPEMLNLCKTKNLYRNLICDFMTENMSSMTDDSYDSVVSSGGMGNGHIPTGALKEMVRIVKPGGYICIAMREEFLTISNEYNNNKLEGLMDNLEKTGKWRKVERRTIDYLKKAIGVMFLYQVL